MQRLLAESFPLSCFRAHNSSKSTSLWCWTQHEGIYTSSHLLTSPQLTARPTLWYLRRTVQLIAWDHCWMCPSGATKQHISSAGSLELPDCVPPQPAEGWAPGLSEGTSATHCLYVRNIRAKYITCRLDLPDVCSIPFASFVLKIACKVSKPAAVCNSFWLYVCVSGRWLSTVSPAFPNETFQKVKMNLELFCSLIIVLD